MAYIQKPIQRMTKRSPIESPVLSEGVFETRHVPSSIPKSGEMASEALRNPGSTPKQITSEKIRENPTEARKAYKNPRKIRDTIDNPQRAGKAYKRRLLRCRRWSRGVGGGWRRRLHASGGLGRGVERGLLFAVDEHAAERADRAVELAVVRLGRLGLFLG